MTTSLRSFRIGLYEEHLEEIGFLYAQAHALRRAPAQSWTTAGDFEQRLEAHTDALVVGGSLALEVCAAHAAADDAGELFGVACVFGRRAEPSLFSRVLDSALPGTPEHLRAIADALSLELPQTWQPGCVRMLGDGDERLEPMLAVVAARRRLTTDGALLTALRRGRRPHLPALLWAAGRSTEAGLPALLQTHYVEPEPILRIAALRSGLRLHDPQAAALAADDAELAALAGGRRLALAWVEQLRGADTPLRVPIALGMLGELSAVRPLVALLEHEPLADVAAQALFVITGAPLFEQTLVPESVQEDELTDGELRRWRNSGEAPRRADGEPFGERVQRLSRSPVAWGEWLAEHGGQFSAGQRYRLGQPCTPLVMLQALLVGLPTLPWRELMIDELQARHGIDPGLDIDLPVAFQRDRLTAAAAQAQASTARPGAWYHAKAELQG
ncbi:hypothetical protein HLB44_05560 [Aquincola sp. S2]|uniref:TIGR02270 family protein n=1 Tax=Pseudaquabacterium terrae TaxID=2732868 RepID=A0ABX2EBZ2_9BURK|nr:hypothetical protein [Aquabacterium terrae]NRF66443.1 hypothetical protein [Aquabacterium terrae]